MPSCPAAFTSKTGSRASPATVGRKKGAWAGFLGGSMGLLRSCMHTTQTIRNCCVLSQSHWQQHRLYKHASVLTFNT